MKSWQGKVALVTGGSSGLGRAIAAELVARGARVAIAARDPAKLQAAAEQLVAGQDQVLAVPADITQQADVERMIGRSIDTFGRLDLLVNCAGRSQRGDVQSTTAEDFAELLDLNLVALVRCTRAALPHLLAAKGHVVNIGSLAGKIGARYMGAYSASKFAVSGYTQQLRLELEPEGLHVLLVSPGPIARDEVRQYEAHKSASIPESARKPGGGAKVNLIRPEKLAAKIIDACERRQPELVVPGKARLLFAIGQLWPGLGDWLVRKFS